MPTFCTRLSEASTGRCRIALSVITLFWERSKESSNSKGMTPASETFLFAGKARSVSFVRRLTELAVTLVLSKQRWVKLVSFERLASVIFLFSWAPRRSSLVRQANPLSDINLLTFRFVKLVSLEIASSLIT